MASALAPVVSQVQLGEVSPWLFVNHPMGNGPAPEGYPCRWFTDLKARRQDWWLRYL